MRRTQGYDHCSHSEIVLGNIPNILKLLAAISLAASCFVSCKSGISEADSLNLNNTPIQTIENVFAVRTTNGKLGLRISSRLIEHSETDNMDYDFFPDGISVFAYTDEGLLESVIIADNAIHKLPKGSRNTDDEVWEAYGNVVLHNVIKQETMETDTLYWDQTKEEIYNDCYVKIYSSDGFMQGYGMRSDDRMRNARLNKVFNNYVFVEKDNTAVIIDAVNFIGHFEKKINKFAP